MSLHPTPTRIALLRDVAAGHVYTSGDDGEIYNDARGDHRKVSARLIELFRPRWVKPVPREDAVQGWAVADDGQAVLDIADAARAIPDNLRTEN